MSHSFQSHEKHFSTVFINGKVLHNASLSQYSAGNPSLVLITSISVIWVKCNEWHFSLGGLTEVYSFKLIKNTDAKLNSEAVLQTIFPKINKYSKKKPLVSPTHVGFRSHPLCIQAPPIPSADMDTDHLVGLTQTDSDDAILAHSLWQVDWTWCVKLVKVSV